MAKFFFSCRKCITAVIREDHAELYGLIKEAGGKPETGTVVKVFTFYHDNAESRHHRREFPWQYAHFTGTTSDLHRLIEAGGHELVEVGEGCGWDGHVPFSNGFEIAETQESAFVTTLGDVLDIFLSSPEEEASELDGASILRLPHKSEDERQFAGDVRA